MEVLTYVEGLVTFVTWLPEAELPRKDDCAIRVFAGLKLSEKLCGDGGLGVDKLVRRTTVYHDEVPVHRMIIVLLCHAATVSVLGVIHILSTAVEDNDDVGARFLTQDPSMILKFVEGFALGCVIEDDLCRVVAHTPMTSIIYEQ